MSCRSGRGKNNEYFRRDSGEYSRTVPFCSKTCPFHSLRKTIGVPTSHVVSRSEPYCHCLTRPGLVKASHTFFAGARIFTVESDVFTCTSPRWPNATLVPRGSARVGTRHCSGAVMSRECQHANVALPQHS